MKQTEVSFSTYNFSEQYAEVVPLGSESIFVPYLQLKVS